MTPPRGTRGSGVAELLVGTLLSLLVLGALTVTIASGGRALGLAGARGEVEDTAQLAVESFLFDARRAGYAPMGAVVQPLTVAQADALTLGADLDGDGAVDPSSEEQIAWLCNRSAQRLSRVVGRQSLPLAEGVRSCRFRYLDATGAPLVVPAAGLDATARTRVRAVALDLELLPTGLRGATGRTALVALRGIQ